MQQHVLEHLLAAFQRVGLMPSVTEQQLQQVLTPEALEQETLIALLAKHYFPEHCVMYDFERVTSKEDLMQLTRMFAAATVGEWTMDDLRAKWEGPEASVIFEFDERKCTLSFEQDSEFINLEYYEQVGSFARYNLSGDFVHIPSNQKNAIHAYLPREIAMEVAFLILLDKQDYMDKDMMLDIFALFQRYDLLVNTVLLDQQLRIDLYDLSSFLEALFLEEHIELQLGIQHLLHYVRRTQNYGYVIDELAKLTNGEWKLDNMTTSYNEKKQETVLQFDSFKHHFVWHITWEPSGLAVFHQHLQEFARDYLRNDFALLPLDDEEEYKLYIYMPKPASQELAQILARGPLVGVKRN